MEWCRCYYAVKPRTAVAVLLVGSAVILYLAFVAPGWSAEPSLNVEIIRAYLSPTTQGPNIFVASVDVFVWNGGSADAESVTIEFIMLRKDGSIAPFSGDSGIKVIPGITAGSEALVSFEGIVTLERADVPADLFVRATLSDYPDKEAVATQSISYVWPI